MRNGNKCTKDFLCDWSDKLVSQNKEFSANLNEWKDNLLRNVVIFFLGMKQFECDICIIRSRYKDTYLQLVKQNLHYVCLMINDGLKRIIKVNFASELSLSNGFESKKISWKVSFTRRKKS